MAVVNEIRQVVRRLMRSPMFTVVTLLTIAIGVGANSAVFSVVNGVLLKPLPYPDPGALIGVWQTAPRLNIKDLEASPSDYFTFREENRTFQEFGVWNGDSVAVTGRAPPEQVRCLFVTEGTLNALGVRPALGRWFTPEDDNPACAGDRRFSRTATGSASSAAIRRRSAASSSWTERLPTDHRRDAADLPVSG